MAAGNGRRKLRPRDVLEDPRLLLMLALGFGCGLPILLVFSTLSAWLATAGIQRTSIGLLSYVSFAYSLKFLWAPVIDRVDVPVLSRLLGRRRAWMVLAQLVVAGGLIGMSFGAPTESLSYIVVCALVTAFASATQDIVVDGWRIDAAPTERQGLMLGSYQLGYAIARACAGAGALYIAQGYGWQLAYEAMALLMLVGIVGCLAAPRQDPVEVVGPRSVRQTLQVAVVEPFGDLIRRKGARLILILSLIMMYRLPDIISGIMAQPFYIDQGFSLVEIANVTKVYGVVVGLLGALAGGWAVMRFGIQASLLFGGIVAAASNLMFAWLAVRGHDTALFVASISIDNFSGNFAGTALIAYMSGLTSPAFVATQYALLSSLYALPGKFIGGFSGYMVDALGYAQFFVVSALIGVPVAILCIALAALGEGREEREAGLPPEEDAVAAKA
ncbi:AmpG family muropeptide MFS transporter [Methylobacterium sp. Leaf118]|uniref:AmpG family muropeptide MFS transporter n=1 Tax=Methylobacterium sp. Leaf118 TaxID=2876562 RepID=UPI001E3771D3|nr:MFS transporter [Methylobacterium sp. Leaf118]